MRRECLWYLCFLWTCRKKLEVLVWSSGERLEMEMEIGGWNYKRPPNGIGGALKEFLSQGRMVGGKTKQQFKQLKFERAEETWPCRKGQLTANVPCHRRLKVMSKTIGELIRAVHWHVSIESQTTVALGANMDGEITNI